MFETLYFMLGLISNILLITIFIMVRLSKTAVARILGFAFLLLSIPSIAGIFFAQALDKPVEYSVFLGIFIGFLLLEGLYDFVLKIDFRRNWKLLIPYLPLYYSMNYGFIVMAWNHSKVQGGIILGLFIIQIGANILSHRKK